MAKNTREIKKFKNMTLPSQEILRKVSLKMASWLKGRQLKYLLEPRNKKHCLPS